MSIQSQRFMTLFCEADDAVKIFCLFASKMSLRRFWKKKYAKDGGIKVAISTFLIAGFFLLRQSGVKTFIRLRLD
jgi:hypothetical protein